MLLIVAIVFLGMQLVCPPQRQAPIDVSAAQAAFKKAVDENNNRGTVDEGHRLVSALRAREAKPDNPDPLLDNVTAVQMEVAEANLAIGIANKNFRDALTAWQEFQAIEKDSENPLAAKAAERRKVAASEVARLAKDFSQHPFIAAGYVVVDFLVRVSGSVGWFSYWFAMLLLAFVVRMLVWPLAAKQYMGFKRMALLSPMIKELQEKYQGPELNSRVMKLYQKYGINPLGGCLPMLVQIPFFLWIYQCVWAYQPEFLNGTFLWINPTTHASSSFFAASLGEQDALLIILYGVSMIVTTMITPTDPSQARQVRMMGLMMSVFFTIMMFFWPLPSAFILYWIGINAVSTVQSLIIARAPVAPLEEVTGPQNGFFKLLGPTEGASGQPKGPKTENKTGAPVLHKPKGGKQAKKRKK